MFIRVRPFSQRFSREKDSRYSRTDVHKDEQIYEFSGPEYFLQISSLSYFKPIYIDEVDTIYFGKYYDSGGGLVVVDSMENLSKASEVDKKDLEAILLLYEIK